MQQANNKLKLPDAKPMLVLLASNNKADIQHLDERLIAEADSVDIRSGVVWIRVSNCRGFLRKLIEYSSDEIKVAFASLEAEPDDLIRHSMQALPIVEIANQLEKEDQANQQLEYEVYYQPIVRLPNRSIIGYEALIRAKTETETFSGKDLVDRATKAGWLAELDELGRKLAIQGLGPWLGAGLIFMNLMAPDGTFDLTAARQTIRSAEDIGLEPDQIVLETSERHKYSNIDLAAAQLNKLRDSGVRLAIDDMGEGYSNLVVATSFKPDVLKLSGEITSSLPSKEAIATVEAIVNMAHSTGAWIVAEKVETEAQADVLRSLDVDWGQGNLFGSPEPKTAGALS